MFIKESLTRCDAMYLCVRQGTYCDTCWYIIYQEVQEKVREEEAEGCSMCGIACLADGNTNRANHDTPVVDGAFAGMVPAS